MLRDERWWAPGAELGPVGHQSRPTKTVLVQMSLQNGRRCKHCAGCSCCQHTVKGGCRVKPAVDKHMHSVPVAMKVPSSGVRDINTVLLLHRVFEEGRPGLPLRQRS
jgi:hypothetical protein